MDKKILENLTVNLDDACRTKNCFDKIVLSITDTLTELSPSANQWYYKDNFFRVNVTKNDYDSYIDFLNSIIGCSYCYTLNKDSLTFMVSLTTLKKKIDEL